MNRTSINRTSVELKCKSGVRYYRINYGINRTSMEFYTLTSQKNLAMPFMNSCSKHIWAMADIVILNSKTLAIYSNTKKENLNNQQAVAKATENIQAFSSQIIIIHLRA